MSNENNENKQSMEQVKENNKCWWKKLIVIIIIIIFLFNIINYSLNHNAYFNIENTTKLKQARLFPNASLMNGNKVLITGGKIVEGSFFSRLLSLLFLINPKLSSPKYLETTELYDINTNKIVSGPNMNHKHMLYKQYLLPNDEVLIADPRNIESYNPQLKEFEKWNVETTVYKTSKIKNSKYDSELKYFNTNMTLLKDGNILITGGAHEKFDNNDNYYTLSNAEILNTKTRTIEKIDDLPFPLANHHIVVDKDGLAYIFGGDIIYKDAPDKKRFHSKILLYNPKNKKFTVYKENINYHTDEYTSISQIDNQKFLFIYPSRYEKPNGDKYICILDLNNNQFKYLYKSKSNINILNNKRLYSFQNHTVLIYDFDKNTFVKKIYFKNLSNAKSIVDIGKNKYLVIDDNSNLKKFLGVKQTKKMYILEIK